MSPKNITTTEIHDDFDVCFTHRLMFDRDVLASDNPMIEELFASASNDEPRP
ncbi:MAG: hypothetical protein GY728_00800, partial [Phycisphaeraceae bacterium]|nr:hypothetical protein [Phycisphaeraceae bacterium]